MMNRPLVLVGIIGVAAASRLVPHLPNVTPLVAMALFGGAVFTSKRAAFLIPLAAMLFSDVAIGLVAGDLSRGLHAMMPFVYGSFVAITALGFLVRRRRSAGPIACATVTASTLFFVVTNFGVWMATSLYPKTLAGLLSCYVAGLPYLRNAVLGDGVFAFLLFGTLALAERREPSPVFAEVRRN